ncbi:MAG: Endolytic murein transglycosylase [Bacteroidia bacterium]|nr:Endolytic murein transglycosylase [Bacteroidia bacterium]
MAAKKKGKSSFLKKILIIFILLLIVGGGIAGWEFYKMIYQPNVSLKGEKLTYIYIPTGSDINTVKNILSKNGIVVDINSFEWVAERKNYKNKIFPGKYLIKAGMSNNELVNLLRSGKQTPVKLVINNVRKKEEIVSLVGKQLEADSTHLSAILKDEALLSRYGLNTENAGTLFIPNTYEFNWNTSAEQFVERIRKEHQKFWTNERKAKAKALKLSEAEIAILASIVEKETQKRYEMPIIAGVYLNRLKKGMLLQADPTLVFASGNFNITRVLNVHKEIDSSYNTYKYQGLPPGPICIPDERSIESVLNYEKHDYLYFCANPDMTFTHVFAKTYEQHLVNARKFQQELNRRKIMN